MHGRKIEIIMADHACNEAKGVAVAKKLISQDQVFLINGGVCSGVALAMRPVIEESRRAVGGVDCGQPEDLEPDRQEHLSRQPDQRGGGPRRSPSSC